ncbi:putative U3 small nucleolar RNA-associated protein 4-like [Capsicum annuum]|nr:putative U3 small nucleolar RNA-associated protein 4-like [Capsicum annuum]
MIAQLVDSQSRRSGDVSFVPGSSKITRVGQFMRLNPPTFTGTKVEEAPKGLLMKWRKYSESCMLVRIQPKERSPLVMANRRARLLIVHGVDEVGPLAFGQKAYNGSLPILVSSPYSLTKFASILFLEQPANTGFSYATTSEAYKCTDLQACDQVFEFLRKWFVNNPEFIPNPFYVSGDSYSGITVPVIVQLISDGIEAGIEPLINLTGYSLGNPKTFPEETNYQIPYCHGMGLISDELYESLNEICKGEYVNIDPTKLCVENYKMFKKLVSGINDQQILEPFCGTDSEEHPPQLSAERRSLKEDVIFQKYDDFICRESRVARRNLSTHWANDPRVQEAIHVRKGTIRRPWARCRQSITYTSYTMTFMNSIPYHVNLSSKGYRSLIFRLNLSHYDFRSCALNKDLAEVTI